MSPYFLGSSSDDESEKLDRIRATLQKRPRLQIEVNSDDGIISDGRASHVSAKEKHPLVNPYRRVPKEKSAKSSLHLKKDCVYQSRREDLCDRARHEQHSSNILLIREPATDSYHQRNATDEDDASAFGFKRAGTEKAHEEVDYLDSFEHDYSIGHSQSDHLRINDQDSNSLEIRRGTSSHSFENIRTPQCKARASSQRHSGTVIGNFADIERVPLDECSRSLYCTTEISPVLYAPVPSSTKLEPIIHDFTERNKPQQSRPLIHVSDLFDPPLNTFWKSSFERFNYLQSEIANVLAYSDDNIVISAPTGAGKTVAFEMAMIRFLQLDLETMCSRHGSTVRVSCFRKMVYISPSKALCEERFKDWETRFDKMNLGIKTVVVTGDTDPSESFRDISSAHLILTTPEKWDSMTRRWTGNFFLFATVKLFMIDEIHLISDESRGYCIESIICRMKSIQLASSRIRLQDGQIERSSYTNTTKEAINLPLRMIGVSATLPNISDVASFLEANEAYSFDESYRPVPLTTYVIGQGRLGEKSTAHFHFWRNLDRAVPEIIRRYCNSRSTIVFCHSKMETEKLSDVLATAYNIGRRDNQRSEIASKTRNSRLQRVLMYGVAFHHASLEGDDRRLVEKAFLDGTVSVLCATSTLAMGVNLPAHLVVVKGTKAYRGARSGYQDLDQTTLLQMIGRAGRPNFDTSGTAVIMTDNDSKARFEKLASSGLPPSRSQLCSKLIEVLNSEISQQVITSVESAINWMKSSLYYVQLLKSPMDSGVSIVSRHSMDTHLLQLCSKAIHALQSISLVKATDGQDIIPCPACHIMSQNLVEFQAMGLITNIPFDACQGQLLKAIAQIEGLQFPVRKNEKRVLNEIHKQIKTFKLDGPLSKVRVQEPWEKAYILLQFYVDEIDTEISFTLKQEMRATVEYASRMISAIEEYSIQASGHGNMIVQSLKLRRALSCRQWSSQDGMLKQIRGISKTTAFVLHMGGISNIEDVLRSTAEQLEKLVGRPAPFGVELRKTCSVISQARLTIRASTELSEESGNRWKLSCRLLRDEHNIHDEIASNAKEKSHGLSYTVVAYLNSPGGKLFYQSQVTCPFDFEVMLPDSFCSISIRLISSIAGLDEKLDIQGNNTSKLPDLRSENLKCQKDTNRRIRNTLYRTSVQREPEERDMSSQFSRRNTSASMEIKTTIVTPSPKPVENSTGLTQQRLILKPHNASSPSLSSGFKVPVAKTSVSPMSMQPKRSSPSKDIDYQGEDYMSSIPVESSFDTSPSIMIPKRSNDYQGEDYMSSIPVESSFDTSPSIMIPKRSNESYSNTSFSNSSTSWKRSKWHQAKTQRRAFATKNDNPFSQYRFDPNDTESYLGALSSKRSVSDTNSIIPDKAIRQLESAYNGIRSGVRNPQLKSMSSFGWHDRGRYKHSKSSGNMTNQELLALKAAEQNAYSQKTYGQISPWETNQQNFAQHQNPYNFYDQRQSTHHVCHPWVDSTHDFTNESESYCTSLHIPDPHVNNMWESENLVSYNPAHQNPTSFHQLSTQPIEGYVPIYSHPNQSHFSSMIYPENDPRLEIQQLSQVYHTGQIQNTENFYYGNS